MSVQRRTWRDGQGRERVAYRVRWEEPAGVWHSKTFATKRDASAFDADLQLRRRRGTLAQIDSGTETLNTYVSQTWAPTFGPLLSRQTRDGYAELYRAHVEPFLGDVPLRNLNPEIIGRWQADRLAAGAGKSSVRKAIGLLGNILQRAAEGDRISSNPVRLVRKVALPKRSEIKPFAPATVERLRSHLSGRDSMLVSLIAYAGLRPGEALALRWGDIRDRTLIVERALSLGEIKETKTGAHRTVRLLAPLAADLREWRMRSGRPAEHELVIPGKHKQPWSTEAYKAWRRQSFQRALAQASGAREHPEQHVCAACSAAPGTPCTTPSGRPTRIHAVRSRPRVEGRPYDLRHSFASLLLHEGRSVIYVARQLGHDARLTLGTYGHVIDEFEDSPQLDAETAIEAARAAQKSDSAAHELPMISGGDPG